MPPRVLGVAEAGDIASGRSFAQYVEAEDGQSRLDAITRSAHGDTGGGVAYQVQYAFRRGSNGEKIWLEDTGRWFAGADGKPVRALGVVRVINERHEHEQRAHAAREVRRPDRRDEPRAPHRGARRQARRGGALSRLARLPAGRHRPSRPPQRILRLRHRRRGDRAGRQAHPRAPARQGLSRPLLRQQVRRHPDHLHGGRIGGRRRPAAGGRARRNHRDRRRSGGGDGDDRRHHRAAPRPHRAGNPTAARRTRYMPRAANATARSPPIGRT